MEPSWTPLLATVSANVTDSGGVLSHSAIVACKYRIPVLASTGNATTSFKNGRLIELDSNTVIMQMVEIAPIALNLEITVGLAWMSSVLMQGAISICYCAAPSLC